MAGFDLSKVSEFIKAVETKIAQQGGDTNSDGKINTAEENTVFSAMLKEEQKAGNLSDDDVNKIWGFVKTDTAKAPAKTLAKGKSQGVFIDATTTININITINADFKDAISEIINNQNTNTQKLLDALTEIINQNKNNNPQEIFEQFIKVFVQQLADKIDLSKIEESLKKFLEALDVQTKKLDESNKKLDEINSNVQNLQELIITIADKALASFKYLNLKADELVTIVKGISNKQEDQYQLLTIVLDVLNKLSNDGQKFQKETLKALNTIIALVQNGNMKSDDLMEILKAIESDTSKNAETSGKILDEVAKGNEISKQILEAIKLMNKELAGVSNEVKNGFLNIVTQLVQLIWMISRNY